MILPYLSQIENMSHGMIGRLARQVGVATMANGLPVQRPSCRDIMNLDQNVRKGRLESASRSRYRDDGQATGLWGLFKVTRYPGAVLKQLNRVFNQGTVSGLTEGKLLERFVAEGDEAAFGALVARHGPMVLGVCRRILRDEHDVEDAFQATFLVLVRRAGAIRDGDLIGHWLHGVAHRVAVRARAQAARRNVHETTGLGIADLGAGIPAAIDDQRDLRAILDEELARLPGSLRSPVVLCYLEGLTHDEAAKQLHWPVGTVRSRMARARDLLRRRLVRRGFTTDGAALTVALARQPVPVTLIDSTVRASLAFATKQATTAGLASATANRARQWSTPVP